ncbi:hypothetical protein JCM16303_000732 [Sporobolomyces ruberrimus]
MSNTSSASSTGPPNRSTTSTPVSQPRPTSTALARGASSAFDFLFGPSGTPVPSPVPTPQADLNGIGTGSDASRVDKGKAVARDRDEGGANERDATERQAKVDQLLKRAEAAKLARAFRNRLALASFKTARGWQDVNLDVIEPHLREEALKRQQNSPSESHLDNPSFPSHPSPSSLPALPTITASHQGLAEPAPPADQPYQYMINYNPRPLDMEAVIGGSGGGGGSAHKRTRSIDPSQGQSQGSPYASNPQASPYSTANVYRKLQESPSDARSTKRRNMDGATPRPRQKSTGGSRKGTPLRQSTNGTPAKPPSSSDSTFSSFVDAAAALTGMARAPSDPSASGSEEEQQSSRPYDTSFSTGQGSTPGRNQSRLGASLPVGSVIHSIPHPPHHHHAFPQPQQHAQSRPSPGPFPGQHGLANGHPSQSYLYASLPLPSESIAPPPRPATPEKMKMPGGGGAGSGENSEVAAADLMLFLAHSPSPVQTRKAQPTLGDASGVKGRRLFGAGDPSEGDEDASGSGSGSGNGLAQSVFGGGIDAFSPSRAPPLSRSTSTTSSFITSSGPSTSRGLDIPFDPTSSTSSASISIDADPSKPSSSHQYLPSSSMPLSGPLGLDSSATSDPHLAFAAPGTPRQRDSSLNGSGWESFINASPSPARATIPRGDTPPGLGRGRGGIEGEAALS